MSPTAFFQTNVGAAEILVKLVVEAVGQSRRVLDLYCGSGLFSLPLARAGATVTAVEENRQAIADAESNVRLNRLPPGQIRFIAARVEDALVRAGKDPWDAVVLDPPRQGCPPAVIAACSGRFARHESSMCLAVPMRSRRNCRLFSRAATASAACSRLTCFRTPITLRP